MKLRKLYVLVPTQRWEGLAAELALDMARLWTRNLGRDDRLLADTSREVWHAVLWPSAGGAPGHLAMAMWAERLQGRLWLPKFCMHKYS